MLMNGDYTTQTAKSGTQTSEKSSDLMFDVGLMAQSAAALSADFGIFGQTLTEIDAKMDEYIGAAAGTYIKSPCAGGGLNALWHSLSLGQMGEFTALFNEWSDEIRAAYIENSEFSEEADRIFDDLLNQNMANLVSGTINGVVQNTTVATNTALTALTYSNQVVLNSLTGYQNNLTDDDYRSGYADANEAVRAVIDAKNQQDAQNFFKSYKRIMDSDRDTFDSMLGKFNPDVRQIVQGLMEGATE